MQDCATPNPLHACFNPLRVTTPLRRAGNGGGALATLQITHTFFFRSPQYKYVKLVQGLRLPTIPLHTRPMDGGAPTLHLGSQRSLSHSLSNPCLTAPGACVGCPKTVRHPQTIDMASREAEQPHHWLEPPHGMLTGRGAFLSDAVSPIYLHNDRRGSAMEPARLRQPRPAMVRCGRRRAVHMKRVRAGISTFAHSNRQKPLA